MGIGHFTLDMYKMKFKGSGFTLAFASRRGGVCRPQQDKWAGARTLRLAPRGQLNTLPQ